MTYLVQSIIFENMVERNVKDAASLSEWHLSRNLEIFRDNGLTQNKSNPNKMMYDSMRILGLIIYVELTETLIKLHSTPDDAELKNKAVQTLICLCFNSKTLKQEDNHLKANVNHLKYLM